MHPAFSVLLFSTLSGAGYGLLAWVSLAALVGAMDARRALWLLLAGLALSTAGLLSSLGHLGKPLRAWRAFSQWRTSWLSREGVMAVLTFIPSLALAAALLPAQMAGRAPGPVMLGTFGIWAGAATVACALLTVVCTAMIYVSLKPVPAWRHALVLPGYLLLSLLSGLALFAPFADPLPLAAPAGIALFAVGALGLKWRYWRAIDASPLPATRGDAVGLRGREVTLFERPHTEANYLTREMGYVLARKHGTTLRWAASLLFGVLPIVLALLAYSMPGVAPWLLGVAALSVLLGLLVERWLFFAQARHMVTLYY